MNSNGKSDCITQTLMFCVYILTENILKYVVINIKYTSCSGKIMWSYEELCKYKYPSVISNDTECIYLQVLQKQTLRSGDLCIW